MALASVAGLLLAGDASTASAQGGRSAAEGRGPGMVSSGVLRWRAPESIPALGDQRVTGWSNRNAEQSPAPIEAQGHSPQTRVARASHDTADSDRPHDASLPRAAGFAHSSSMSPDPAGIAPATFATDTSTAEVTQQADLFEDPFGDNLRAMTPATPLAPLGGEVAQRRQDSPALASSAVATASSRLAPLRGFDEADGLTPIPSNASNEDATSDLTPPSDSLVASLPTHAVGGAEQAIYDPACDDGAPVPTAAVVSAPKKNDPAYAGRDCEGSQALCRRVSFSAIQDIALNVTPPYDPTGRLSNEEEVDALRQRLADAPSRTWSDASGRQLAEGRLVDLHQGIVTIESTTGQSAQLPLHTLGYDERCFVASWWKLPVECVVDDEPFAPRCFTPSTFTWRASALCNKPLYFEDVQLERYGHTVGPLLQPAASGAHFFINIATLPYRAAIHPPYECRYDLGYYRPGSCAPWLVPPVPVSLRGGLMQAGVVTGAAFLIP